MTTTQTPLDHLDTDEFLTFENYCEHARRGLQRLDTLHPGWAERVDVGALSLTDCHTCVLAQALGEGSYIDGVRALFGEEDHSGPDVSFDPFNRAANHGFDAVEWAHDNDCLVPDADAVDHFWREAVLDRR